MIVKTTINPPFVGVSDRLAARRQRDRKEPVMTELSPAEPKRAYAGAQARRRRTEAAGSREGVLQLRQVMDHPVAATRLASTNQNNCPARSARHRLITNSCITRWTIVRTTTPGPLRNVRFDGAGGEGAANSEPRSGPRRRVQIRQLLVREQLGGHSSRACRRAASA